MLTSKWYFSIQCKYLQNVPFKIYIRNHSKSSSNNSEIVTNMNYDHSDDGVLNRNVALVKFDEEGLTFVTERASKKYKNFVRTLHLSLSFVCSSYDIIYIYLITSHSDEKSKRSHSVSMDVYDKWHSHY